MRVASLSGSRAYTYDRLYLQSLENQIFTQDFDSSDGFTFDDTQVEFLSGQVQQIDKTVTDATAGATFTNNQNFNFGGGDLTGTLSGSASVSGGFLNLTGGYADYDGVGKINATRGAVKFKIVPNFTGDPPADYTFFSYQEDTGSDRNSLHLYIDSGNRFRFTARSSAGANIANFQVIGPPATFVAGVEVEIEFNWDFGTGFQGLFLDGVLFGSTSFSGTVDDDLTTVQVFQLGAKDGVGNTNFDLTDVLLFTPSQHSIDYTPGYTVPENIFEESLVTLPAFEYSGEGDIVALTDFLIIGVDGGVVFNLNGLFFNGSDWTTSDDTTSQMNSATVIAANLSTFPLSNNLTFKTILPGSNTTQSSVSNLHLGYTGQELVKTPTSTIEPDPLVVSLETFKAHIKKTGTTSEDQLLTTFLQAAIAYAERRTGLEFSIKYFQGFRDFFPSPTQNEGYYYQGVIPAYDSNSLSSGNQNVGFEIKKAPLHNVNGIVYLDSTSGLEVTVDPVVYYFSLESAYSEILTNVGQCWPENARVKLQSIRIRFQAGMAYDSETFEIMFPDLTVAILEHATNMWANRGDCADKCATAPSLSEETYKRFKIINL